MAIPFLNQAITKVSSEYIGTSNPLGS